MGLIQSSKGRFDSTLTDVMNDIRQPVFVDNAVHYAKSQPKSNAKTKVTIEAVNSDNYEIASEKTYTITESESALLLNHTESDGHTLKADIYTPKGKNATSKLLFGKEKEEKRVLVASTESTTSGLRADMRNMRGSTLKKLGFDDTEVRVGQTVDVGLRTTDLALRVGDEVNDGNVRFGNKDTSPIENVENRITVKGIPIAVNEELVFTMDDRGKQQGAHDVDVVENTSPLFDASITNLTRAKTVARQILRANSTLTGSIRTQGHPNCWELRPGDVVEYEGNRLSILEARHTLSGMSDFVFLSADSGLEGVLQNIREGSITTSTLTNPDKSNQIVSENFSFFDSLELVITPTIKVITSNEAGLLIGRNSDRGRLGGNYKTIGMAKDDGIIIEEGTEYVG